MILIKSLPCASIELWNFDMADVSSSNASGRRG